MKTKRLRYSLLVLSGLCVLFVLAVLLGLFRTDSVSPESRQPLSDAQMKALIPAGRELALAGNCMGCHSQAQGPRGAGGVPIDTPFGTLHSTNITPDKTYGIGNYTREDFHRVLRDGIAPGRRNLYPGMPYVFTHVTRAQDIDALYAYVMNMPSIAQENVPNTGVFTLPVRPFVNFWTLINFPDRKPPSRAGASEQWLRGGYLVEGLGHCGACHTPRNVTMGVSFARSLEGGQVIDGLLVPAITAATLAQRGFDSTSLSQYLRTGWSAQGTSFGSMHAVTHFSTSAMQADDVDAIAVYLMTSPKGELLQALPSPEALPVASDAALQSGRRSYVSACAGCHGVSGEGIPNVAPAMRGNSVVMMQDPTDLVTVALHGVQTQTFAGNGRMYAMPGFADRMSPESIATMLTWMRAQWGGQSQPVTVEQVREMIPKTFH